MKYQLNHWCVFPYSNVAFGFSRLYGYRKPSGNDYENNHVITSTIERIDGKNITTFSGNVYTLMDPDPDYLEYLESNGIAYDDNCPIVIDRDTLVDIEPKT